MVSWFLVISFFGIFQSISTDCDAPSLTTYTNFGKQAKSPCSGDIIFEENFDKLDTSTWPHEVTLSGFGNGDFEYYADDRRVSYAKDGILHIKPRLVSTDKGEDFLYNGTIDLGNACTTKEECKRTGQPGKILNPVMSARLRTRNTFSFRYGKLEVRVKCPTGNWLWPAVWLLPATSQYGPWPRSGEIDIMETRGNLDLGYPFTAASTLHWGPDRAHNMWRKTHYPKGDGSGYQVFHYFQFEWTPDHISFSVDDHHYGKISPPEGGFWELGNLSSSGLPNLWKGHDLMAPFDQEFYIVINLAIGGTSGYFPESYGKPWKNFIDRYEAMSQFWAGKKQWIDSWKLDTEQSDLQVDYVRVWAL